MHTPHWLAYPMIVMALFGPVQDWLLYYPDRYDPTVAARLSAKAGLQAWPSADAYRGFIVGESLNATGGTLVVFHGNAGSAVDRTYYRDFLMPLGVRIVLLEYPGYGAREGKPGEAALVTDGAESLRLILAQYGRPIYVLGESLGAAVATGALAAARIDVDGLVLCSPWDDLLSVARALYWFLPVQALVRDRYDSRAYLKSYTGPLAVIVADRDELVPRQSSLRLYETYPGPKKLWILRGTHNTWLGATSRPWWQSVFQFLREESKR
jgi:pimeloyl-ACP methyl ester carboxylesterase